MSGMGADWIDGMTTRFRSSGFPRRYFRDGRELVNSLVFAEDAMLKARKQACGRAAQPPPSTAPPLLLSSSPLPVARLFQLESAMRYRK